MASTQNHNHRRDAAPLFDPRTFYTIRNPSLPFTQQSVAIGPRQNSPGPLTITPYNTSSSENWQIFPQGGRYFIRNYDYGSGYQLGLTQDSRFVPRLYARTGNFSQQWSIMPVEGGFRLMNGLWENGTYFGVTGSGTLGMSRDEDGAVWNVTRNESADKTGPKDVDMFNDVAGFEVSSPLPCEIEDRQADYKQTTPSPTPTPSNSLSSTIFPTSSPTSTTSLLPNTSSLPPSSKPSSALSPGGIAGIAIGALLLVGALSMLVWYLTYRRKRATQNPYEVPYHAAALQSEKYAHRVELHAVPEIGSSGVWSTDGRAELEEHRRGGEAVK